MTIVEADVTDQAALNQIAAGCDRIDAVVTCAGLIKRIEEHDPEVFAEVLAVNLTGTMRTLVACKPKLVESGGAAIGIASILTWAAGGMRCRSVPLSGSAPGWQGTGGKAHVLCASTDA